MKTTIGIVIIVLLVSGCEESTIHNPSATTRSFYMGMTPHPHDYTQEGVEEAYKILEKHTDMIAHHFDDGIPWPEA